jgi:RNA polymerase sigma-70 factor (ECF subfamily)
VQDHELIEKIKIGDAAAFQELFERYKKLVINVCFRLIGNKDEAEDLTQDVFLKIFNSARHFKHRSQVSTWIYRIAINRSLNHLRQKKYQRWFSLDSDLISNASLDFERSSDESPERDFQKQEREKIVLNAIKSLPVEQQVALMLQRYDGLSCEEIAAIVNCSIGAVQARLHRAKKNLYQKLLPYLKEID